MRIAFVDGTEYPVPGFINFLDFAVDTQTGTVQLRAQFPNPSEILLPGEFVRARIFVGELQGGIAIPQRAVTVNEQGGSVFVIDGEGKAALRPVRLGAMIDGRWIVESGLTVGDEVIVSNLQKLRPGAAVTRSNTPNGRNTDAANPGGS